VLEQSLNDEVGWTETLALALPLSYTRSVPVQAGQTGGSPICGKYRVNATKWYSFSLYSAIFSRASLLSYRREWPDAPVFSRSVMILRNALVRQKKSSVGCTI
jgi:hypothetical protein